MITHEVSLGSSILALEVKAIHSSIGKIVSLNEDLSILTLDKKTKTSMLLFCCETENN